MSPAARQFDLSWLESERERINAAIAEELKSLNPRDFSHSRLLDAVQYSLNQPGKRVRPALVREACRVCGGRADDATPAALAIEWVHTFSLIHDDLPAMDDDELRRGKPTNHVVFGEAGAILAGDWLLADAFRLLATRDKRAGALTTALSSGTLGMIAGQAADIEGESKTTDKKLVEFIHRSKTASLIRAACEMGAICADADPPRLAALRDFGEHLGLAFQIVDDLLDRTGTTESLGKRAGKDAADTKQTYPDAFGMEESRRAARRQVDAATRALSEFGDAADRLRGLAEYVLTRDR